MLVLFLQISNDRDFTVSVFFFLALPDNKHIAGRVHLAMS